MSSRKVLTYITGALAIFGTTGVQAATIYNTEADFMGGLGRIGLPVSTTHEGFDLAPWGVNTNWLTGVVKPSVSNSGITWMPLATNNGGFFATSTGGGDVHDGEHQMYAVASDKKNHPIPDGYSLAANNNNLLYAAGGWFRSTSGAKLGFFLDDESTPNRVDFTGGQSTLFSDSGWMFLGFIDTAGFKRLRIQAVDENLADGETKIFFSDDFTFAGVPGALTPNVPLTPPIPLPAALPLFGSALLGFIGIAWRRRFS